MPEHEYCWWCRFTRENWCSRHSDEANWRASPNRTLRCVFVTAVAQVVVLWQAGDKTSPFSATNCHSANCDACPYRRRQIEIHGPPPHGPMLPPGQREANVRVASVSLPQTSTISTSATLRSCSTPVLLGCPSRNTPGRSRMIPLRAYFMKIGSAPRFINATTSAELALSIGTTNGFVRYPSRERVSDVRSRFGNENSNRP